MGFRFRDFECLDDRITPAPADLVSSFNGGQFVVLNSTAPGSEVGGPGTDLAMLPDGGTVIVGDSIVSPTTTVSVLTASGTLDPAFSGDGRLQMNLWSPGAGYTTGFTSAVTTFPDGRIVLGGSVASTKWDGIVTVLKSDGTRDTSFVGDGSAYFYFNRGGNNNDLVTDVLTLAGGGMLVAGTSATAGRTDLFVAKLIPNGTFDTSWGNGTGYQFYSTGQSFDGAVRPALAPNNRVYLLGRIVGGTNVDSVRLFALNATTGQPDTGFGGTQPKTVRFPNPPTLSDRYVSEPIGPVVTADGRVVVAANVNWFSPSSEADVGVWVFRSDGTPDTSFGGDGMIYLWREAGLLGHLNPSDLAFLPNGGFAITGSDTDTIGYTPSEVVVLRANGTLDTSFNGTGSRVFDVNTPSLYSGGNPPKLVIGSSGTITLMFPLQAVIGSNPGTVRDRIGVTRMVGYSPPPPPNTPPIAREDHVSGSTAGITFSVLGNDADPDGDPLTILSTTSPARGSLTALGNGSFRYLAFDPSYMGADTFQYTVSDSRGGTATATVFLLVVGQAPNPGIVDPPPIMDPPSETDDPEPIGGGAARTTEVRIVVGADAGSPPLVRVFRANGEFVREFHAFEEAFLGGVRVASADVTGDGIPDIFAVPGPGRGPMLRAFNGDSGELLWERFAFEESFLGGCYVAAGDLSGDGIAEVVVTPDQGGGPVVAIFSGQTSDEWTRFYGIDDPAFRGGARAALGDVNGDRRLDLLVAAGFGGGPRLAIFNGATVLGDSPSRLVDDFFVFEQTLRNGVFIAAGDVNGDGDADVIVGGGPGGGPRVQIHSGAATLARLPEDQTILADFFAGDAAGRLGVRVAAGDLDGDGKADVLSAAGSGGPVFAYRVSDLAELPVSRVPAMPGNTPVFVAVGEGEGADDCGCGPCGTVRDTLTGRTFEGRFTAQIEIPRLLGGPLQFSIGYTLRITITGIDIQDIFWDGSDGSAINDVYDPGESRTCVFFLQGTVELISSSPDPARSPSFTGTMSGLRNPNPNSPIEVLQAQAEGMAVPVAVAGDPVTSPWMSTFLSWENEGVYEPDDFISFKLDWDNAGTLTLDPASPAGHEVRASWVVSNPPTNEQSTRSLVSQPDRVTFS